MDAETRKFIKRIYADAHITHGIDYFINTLKQKGIDVDDPTVLKTIREIEKEFNIHPQYSILNKRIKLDDITKEFIEQVYVDAMTLYGPDYMIETLEKEGLNNNSEVRAFIKKLDEKFGIF